MAKQDKVPGKAKKEGDGNRRYKIEPAEPDEVELELELLEGGNYEVEKLETESLPRRMPEPDNKTIQWFNNFSIKEHGRYISKPYKVKIPNLREKLKLKNSRVVIYSDTHDPKLYYYEGGLDGDTLELNDGDPATGMSP